MHTSQVQIKIYSFYHIFINKIIQILKIYFKNFNFINIKIIKLPTKFKKFTVLKAPHIDKKSKEQFESRLYTTLICVNNLLFYKKKKLILDQFIKYLKNLNLNKKKSFLPIKIKIKSINKI